MGDVKLREVGGGKTDTQTHRQTDRHISTMTRPGWAGLSEKIKSRKSS